MKKLSDIWLKASVAGSLWASVEIIIGSFFHNLRVPMAGTILAMLSVVIMVAFHQQWKEKGLFWRAGIICALMKSISPSAILLGPMTGIMAEALIMEVFVRLLGGNIAGYMLGGAFALMSTIAHKIANLLLIYGFDFVKVLVNLYEYAAAQIGYSELKPVFALWILFGIYGLLGFVSAIAGVVIGKNKRKPDGQNRLVAQLPQYNPDGFLSIKKDQHFSVKLLFFHFFALAISLVTIGYSMIYGSLFILIYVLFSVYHYRQSLKHLKRPFFWVQVIVLTFLATLFYNGFQKGNIFDAEGLMAGLQMNVRAVLILVGFSSLSVELRNPVIKTMLMKRGFSQLYLSLGLAFSVLPWIIKNIPKPSGILKSPGSGISNILNNADELLRVFKQINAMPKVVIITGEKHQGKTTFVSRLTKILESHGKRAGGFIAPGKFEDNRRASFNIVDLDSNTSKPLCSIHFESGEKAGPFRFDAGGQEMGHALLSPGKIAQKDFVVVDEIGPLELNGDGWAKSIDTLMLQPPGITLIFVVRKSLLEKVIAKWNLVQVKIVDIHSQGVEEVAQSLLKSWD